MNLDRVRRGISGDLKDWVAFNRHEAFASAEALAVVAPFPPTDLMNTVSPVTEPRDFASHGCDFLEALSTVSPTPLNAFTDVLDFGIGPGRLARMFKGFQGRYTGVDVDARHLAWVSSALDYVTAIATEPKRPLPLADRRFDCIISISVFTHMNERDQIFYLEELARVARPGAILLITVHGERALRRAETDPSILTMLSVPEQAIADTRVRFPVPGFSFILQQEGHLTTSEYDYGITFISQDYVGRVWSRYFDVVRVSGGGIHDFQDIVVLRAR